MVEKTWAEKLVKLVAVDFGEGEIVDTRYLVSRINIRFDGSSNNHRLQCTALSMYSFPYTGSGKLFKAVLASFGEF